MVFVWEAVVHAMVVLCYVWVAVLGHATGCLVCLAGGMPWQPWLMFGELAWIVLWHGWRGG